MDSSEPSFSLGSLPTSETKEASSLAFWKAWLISGIAYQQRHADNLDRLGCKFDQLLKVILWNGKMLQIH